MFDSNYFRNTIRELETAGCPFDCPAELYRDIIEDSKALALAAEAYETPYPTDEAEADFKEKYRNWLEKCNKALACLEVNLTEDEKAGVKVKTKMEERNAGSARKRNGNKADDMNVVIPDLVFDDVIPDDPKDKVIGNEFMPRYSFFREMIFDLKNMNKCLSDHVSKERLDEYGKGVKEPESFTREIREERLVRKPLSDIIKKIGDYIPGQYYGRSSFLRIKRNIEELDSLEKSFDEDSYKNLTDKRDRRIKKKSILLLEKKIRDEVRGVYNHSLENGTGYFNRDEALHNTFLLYCDSIAAELDRRIVKDLQQLKVLSAKNTVKTGYEEYADLIKKNAEARKNAEEGEAEEELNNSRKKKNENVGFFEEAKINENWGEGIKNVEYAEPDEGLNLESELMGFGKAEAYEKDDKLLEKILDDKNFNDDLEHFREEELNLDNDAAVKDIEEKETAEPEYAFEIEDLEEDMVGMLKAGNKNVYFGSGQYDKLITMTEDVIRAKKVFEARKPEFDREAYLKVLQTEAVLNKQMDDYIKRKQTEINNAHNAGKTPNFNSERRLNLVSTLRENFVKIRNKDLSFNPRTVIKEYLKAEEVKRNNKKKPLEFEEYRRSIAATLYLSSLLLSAGNGKGSREKLAEGIKVENYKAGVSGFNQLIISLPLNNQIKTEYERLGGDAFFSDKSKKISSDMVTAFKDSFSSIKAGINNEQDFLLLHSIEAPGRIETSMTATEKLLTDHKLLIDAAKVMGYSAAIEKSGYKLKKADEVLKEVQDSIVLKAKTSGTMNGMKK